MTLKGQLTQQASGASHTFSHPLNASTGFARDFTKNQTENSDNTAKYMQPNLV